MRNYIMATLLLSATFIVNAQSATVSSPQIIAHRAGTADAPENTLPAIDKALSNGVDAIWITLQLSKDNCHSFARNGSCRAVLKPLRDGLRPHPAKPLTAPVSDRAVLSGAFTASYSSLQRFLILNNHKFLLL